jgi:hypothetical protein
MLTSFPARLANASDNKDKLDPHTITYVDHNRRHKRPDLPSMRQWHGWRCWCTHGLSEFIACFANANGFAQLRVCTSPTGPIELHNMLVILITPVCSCTDPCSPRAASSGMLFPRLHTPSHPSTYATEMEAVAGRFNNPVCCFNITSDIPATSNECHTRRICTTWLESITSKAHHKRVGVWDFGGRSANEHEHILLALHMIQCNTRTTCPHCRFVGLDCTTPL